MKKIMVGTVLALVALVALAVGGWRQSAGTGSTSAYVLFTPDPQAQYYSQLAVAAWDVTSDSAGGSLSFLSSYAKSPILGSSLEYTILATITVTSAANTTNSGITFGTQRKGFSTGANGTTNVLTKANTTAFATSLFESFRDFPLGTSNLTAANPSPGVVTLLGVTNQSFSLTADNSGQWQILALVTITNVSYLTNGTLTIGADTRTWAGTANSASVIQATDTIANNAVRLVADVASFPFDGIVSAASSTDAILLTAARNTPLTVTAAPTTSPASNYKITATVTITNVANITNGTIAYLANKTRTWTTDPTAVSNILVGATAAECATNLMVALTNSAFQFTNVTAAMGGAAIVTLVGASNTPVALTFSPATWGSVTYVTNPAGAFPWASVTYTTNSYGAWGTIAYTTNHPSFWKLQIASTNGLIAPAECVLLKADGSTVLTSITNYYGDAVNGTNIMLCNDTNWATGTMIYSMATNATRAIGNATAWEAGDVLFVTPATNMFLMRVTGASACSINNAVVKTLP